MKSKFKLLILCICLCMFLSTIFMLSAKEPPEHIIILIQEDFTLSSNVEFYGLILLSGTLDLNGYTLTINSDVDISVEGIGGITFNSGKLLVKGNIIHTGGEVNIGTGTLEVEGDYSCTDDGFLSMDDDSGIVSVYGDFLISSNNNNSQNSYLQAGTIYFYGDFTQSSEAASTDIYNFYTSDKHRVVFCGNDIQTISINSTNSGFSNFESKNPLTVIENASGYIGYIKLNADSVIDFISGWITIDLNSYVLEVKRNIYHNGGVITVGTGKLEVEGNYYCDWGGLITMYDDSGVVSVHGDFSMNSTNNYTYDSYLQAGTMFFYNNFKQYIPNATIINDFMLYNFNTSGTHKVVLCGNDLQTISFDSSKSKFTNLILTRQLSEYNLQSDYYTNLTIDEDYPLWTYDYELNRLSHPSSPYIISQSDKQITFSWSYFSTKDIAGYKIYRNNEFLTATTEKTYTDTGLIADTPYTYIIIAYDMEGNESEPSPAKTLITVSPSIISYSELNDIYYIENSIIELWANINYDSNLSLKFLYRVHNINNGWIEITPETPVGLYHSCIFDVSSLAANRYVIRIALMDGDQTIKAYEQVISLTNDTTSPTINYINPSEDGYKRDTVEININASDNNELKNIKVNYRKQGTTDWLYLAELSEMYYPSVSWNYTWDISSFSDGFYEIKVLVTDTSDLICEKIVIYTIDGITTPTITEFTTQSAHKSVLLNWSSPIPDNLLKGYMIYRAESEDGIYNPIGNIKSTSFIDKISVGTYYYKIIITDIFGDTSESIIKSGISVIDDPIPPTAVIDNEIGYILVGNEITFSGEMSTDNDEIISYLWDFGDGTTSSTVNTTHIYNTTGEYSISLTVKDAADNINTQYIDVTVIENIEADGNYGVINLTVKNAITNDVIPNAQITISSNDYQANHTVNISGYVSVVLPVGNYTIYVYAAGHGGRSIDLEVIDEIKDYDIGLSIQNTVIGKIEVKELTLEEIIDAGIDINDPNNQHIKEYEIEYNINEVYTVPITIKTNDTDTIVQFTSPFPYVINPGGGYTITVGPDPITFFPISEGGCIIIYGDAYRIKQIFHAQLLMTNLSQTDQLTACEAELILPEGLSLAKMKSGSNTSKAYIGVVANDTYSTADWYICGDKGGEYGISINVKGIFQPFNEPFFATYSTSSDAIKVIYTGTFRYASGDVQDFTSTYYYDDNYFKESSYIYNQNLATMSLCLAMSAFGSNEESKVEDKPYDLKHRNVEALLGEIGFANFQKNDCFNEKPTTDSIGIAVANKKITVGIKDYTLIAVAVRGGGYEREWASNFKLGEEGLHEGFNKAKIDVLLFLSDYIKNLEGDGILTGDVKLWITGYSRAAATANLVAASIIKGEPIINNFVTIEPSDLYAYCFECPQGALFNDVFIYDEKKATTKKNPIYDNIFNIINPNDFVTKVAPSAKGFEFSRYGTDIDLPKKLDRDYLTQVKNMLDCYYVLDNTTEYTVDDFTSFGLTETSYIENGNLKKKTQDLFLDEFLNKLFKERIISRKNYVEVYQTSIFEILSIFNEDSKAPDAFVEMIFANKKYLIPLIPYLGFAISTKLIDVDMYGCISGNIWLSPVATIMQNFIVEVFADAGITSYTDEQIKTLVTPLLKLILKTLVCDTSKAITLICNFNNIGSAHYPELCLAWMQSWDDNYKSEAKPVFRSSSYKIIRINCPVDVEVYDETGNLVAAIKSDIPQDISGSNIISAINTDGEKIVYFPAEDDYDFKITATDNGILNFSINEFSAEIGQINRIVNYFNINITKDDIITGTIPGYNNFFIENGTVDGTSTAYTLSGIDGNAITPSSDLKGESATDAYYMVYVESENYEYGIVTGQGIRQLGNFAQVTAEAADGYKFAGWYSEDTCISTDSIYRFLVTEEISLIAKFTKINAQTPVFETNLNTDEVVYIRNQSAIPLEVKTKITDGGTVTYQWYKNSNKTAIVDNNHMISDEIKEEYTPTTTELGTIYYYCVAANTLNNTVSSEISNIAMITVSADELEKAMTDAQNTAYPDISQTADMNEEMLHAYVKNVAETAINNENITVTITNIIYTDPTAGTSQDPDGINGSFKFNIKVLLDEKSKTTDPISFIIKATEYIGMTDEQIIEAAVNLITGSSFIAPQNTANTPDEIKEWLNAQLIFIGLDISTSLQFSAQPPLQGVSSVEVTSIFITDFTSATAGTAQNHSGINGGFNALINLKKNSITDIVTISGIITASPYTGPIIIPVESITVIPSSETIGRIGDKICLSVLVTPYNATTKNVIWSITNFGGDKYVSVNKNGVVTAKAEGVVTVRATAVDGSGVFGETVITIDTSSYDQWFSWYLWYTNYNNQNYIITSVAGEGGSITPEETRTVQRSQDIMYTISPDEGYIISDVIVDGISVGAVYTYMFRNVTSAHTISAEFGQVVKPWSNPFTDVTGADSFYEAVKFVNQNGLFYGVSDTEFAPETAMTRAMFVTVLGRLADINRENYKGSSFEDVEADQWYSPYVEWGAQNEIIKGYDSSKFALNDEITVEQAVVILYRYSLIMGYDIKSTGNFVKFKDGGDVSDWAVIAMKWAVGKGIYTGEIDRILPTKKASRALIADMLYKYTDTIE